MFPRPNTNDLTTKEKGKLEKGKQKMKHDTEPQRINIHAMNLKDI